MQFQQQHTFHIPVMGLAYTLDSPIKVAHYGISSVMSIIEDSLIELMRGHYYSTLNEPFVPISKEDKDYREKRVTDYLNLVHRIVQAKVEKVRNAAFEAGSEIEKYFEMLPTENKLRQMYFGMKQLNDPLKVREIQDYLRKQIMPGSIDVNIMTKVDRDTYDRHGKLVEEGSDALTALKGYAKSTLSNSSIVFSAGLNPRLYSYLEKFKEFEAKGWGEFEKKIILKVSDFRSALIQGKFLAKKGLWVSEFRIESGLNCGGHAFATDGYLLGPILEEFKNKKEELIASLFQVYAPAVKAKGGEVFDQPHPLKVTVQGGIGTHEEDAFLRDHYGVESTGWGTPFLLCPEATTVDDETMGLLAKAKEKDVELSHHSPLGIRFHYLKGTSADRKRKERIDKGLPGSPCSEKYLVTNTEFTERPICLASHKYQAMKIKQLEETMPLEGERKKEIEKIVEKECLCIGLSNSAILKYGLTPIKKRKEVTMCPGPNIAYFDKVVSLREMTDHIYGRADIVEADRPHMFIKELSLYVDYWKELLLQEMGPKQTKHVQEFHKNLMEGISYYHSIAPLLFGDPLELEHFNATLSAFEEELGRYYETSLVAG